MNRVIILIGFDIPFGIGLVIPIVSEVLKVDVLGDNVVKLVIDVGVRVGGLGVIVVIGIDIVVGVVGAITSSFFPLSFS